MVQARLGEIIRGGQYDKSIMKFSDMIMKHNFFCDTLTPKLKCISSGWLLKDAI